jgi:hypothetical protein
VGRQENGFLENDTQNVGAQKCMFLVELNNVCILMFLSNNICVRHEVYYIQFLVVPYVFRILLVILWKCYAGLHIIDIL